jgi:O-antigen/teichoic acid export membrane protein
MKSLLRKLFQQSSIYAVGDILTKGAGLLLLPLYTAYLTPEDYGILAVANVVVVVTSVVMTLGLRGAALKFYYNYEGVERREFYGSVWLVMVVGSGTGFIVLDQFGSSVFGVVLSKTPYDPYIRIALVIAFATGAFLKFAKQFLKASERATAYASISFGVFLLSTAGAIWLVVFEDRGASGVLIGRMAGTLIFGLGCAVFLFRFIRVTVQWGYVRKAVRYSLPLVPHFLAHWVLSSADRILLERFLPLSDVGIYNVGYKIGTGLSVLAVAANNAFIPLYGKLDRSDEESVTKVVRTATYYVGGITVGALILSLLSEEVIELATPASYHLAGDLVPWIVIGYLFMALYFPAANVLTITLSRSEVIGAATTIGAASNVVLNIIFIPILGVFGAAITTAFTYFIMMSFAVVFSWYVYPISYEWGRIVRLLGSGALTFALAWSVTPEGVWVEAAAKAVFLPLFPLFLFVSGFFTAREKKEAVELWRRGVG